MMIRGYEIGARLIAYIVGGVLIVALLIFGVHYCEKTRSQAAQARVERSQAEATANSAADAINTVTGVGSNQAASEELGRANERDIRAAQGAGDRIGAGVNAAGRAALCKRAAYLNDPKCKGVRP